MYTILGLRFYLFKGYRIFLSPYSGTYIDYYKKHRKNLKAIIKNLKDEMDAISCAYVDKIISISKYWSKLTKNDFNFGWTDFDLQEKAEFEKQNFKQPFPDIAKFNMFIFHSLYGLKYLPEEVFSKINGKDIIDAGGYVGDTAVMFASNFKNSNVYVYEPLIENMACIKKIIATGKYPNIIPVNKGLGNKNEQLEISFNYKNMAEIVKLDDDYKGNNLGVIKSDTEGFESNIIEGAAELIKKFKPVLTFAMYHSAEDFFELKNKILAVNPGYKFMIRHSEMTIPGIELVLIAY